MRNTANRIFIVSLAVAGLLCGCAVTRAVWRSEPTTQSVENEYYRAEVAPVLGNVGCQAFRLTVTNKTTRNLELDWNRTLYVQAGQTSGGFMFEGVVYKDRNSQKSPDVIFAGGRLAKVIWPNNLVHFSSGRYGGWLHLPMPPGENGVYLSVHAEDKEVPEKLCVTLSREVIQSDS